MYQEQSIHILRVDPKEYDIELIQAYNQNLGRKTVGQIVEGEGAVAGVNGGFYVTSGFFEGMPKGSLKIGSWHSLPTKVRGTLGWSSSDEKVVFDRITARVFLQKEDQDIEIYGLNTPRPSGQAVIYTPSFNPSTLTDKGIEASVVEGKVVSLSDNGDSLIPKEGFVLSIDPLHPLANDLQIGQEFSYYEQLESVMGFSQPSDWDAAEFVLEGAPLLIYEGKELLDGAIEKTLPTFMPLKHARTCMGILPTGEWVFALIDKSFNSKGMTILELSSFMLSLGCKYALNLDGGSSTTLFYDGSVKSAQKNGGVFPKVSNAIVVKPKKELP